MKRTKRRKNPKDEDLLKQIQIEKTPYSNKQDGIYLIEYRIFLNDELIGGADYIPYYGGVANIGIDENYKRKGLATYLYDYIENDLRIELEPTGLTDEGEKFWKNRLEKKNKSSKNLWQNKLKKYTL